MSAFVDGELQSAGRRRLERHVGECHECRLLLAGLRAMLNGLHGLHGLAAPSGHIDAEQLAATVRLRLREPRS
jgi:anti-sigma factor RsiW